MVELWNIEQWNNNDGTVSWNSVVEQCDGEGGTVQQ